MAATPAHTRASWRAVPWIGILAAIAVVQLVRAQPFDTALFGAAAVLLTLDTVGAVRLRVTRPTLRMPLLLALAAAVAAVLVLAPRHGLVTGIAVGLVGLVAVPLAWLRPPARAAEAGETDAARRRIRIRRAAVGWAAVVLVMCLVELWSFLAGRLTTQAQGQHPAISELLDPALDTPLGRLVFAVCWLALGVLLITRGRRRPDA